MGSTSRMVRYLAAVVVPAVVLSMTGCQPSRKPLPSPTPVPRIVTERPYPSRNPAITAEENNGLNTKLSNVVQSIKGTKRASVLVIGTSAYAGFEVEKGVDKARLEAIRSEMATAIRRAEPRITAVWTAPHPTTVNRINRVRGDIRAKKPASSYASEVRSILNESDLVK